MHQYTLALIYIIDCHPERTEASKELYKREFHLTQTDCERIFYSVEFISDMYPSTSSFPKPFSDDVTNTGGNSSHSSSNFAL